MTTLNSEDRRQRREEKRKERETRRADLRSQREQARAQRTAEAAAQAADQLERYGREVTSGAFGGKTVRIYDKGFVSIGGLFGGGATTHRLLSIEASSDVAKKSGTGRAAAAVMTGGLNLLGSNKRGDVYLTIVTDQQTHVLRETPPTATNMATSKKLEAAGNTVLQAAAETSAPTATPVGAATGGARERMLELQALRDDGLITQDEFEEKRRKLLDEL